MVIVTAVVFNDDAMRKFICRVDDDCGEGVDGDNCDDCGDCNIYLRMRQPLCTVFVNMVRNEQLLLYLMMIIIMMFILMTLRAKTNKMRSKTNQKLHFAELNVGSREEQAAALPPPLPPSQQSS